MVSDLKNKIKRKINSGNFSMSTLDMTKLSEIPVTCTRYHKFNYLEILQWVFQISD